MEADHICGIILPGTREQPASYLLATLLVDSFAR